MKEYDFFGKQYTKEDFVANCTCLSEVVKGALNKALTNEEMRLADQVREKKKFLINLVVKGAKAAGMELSDFDVVDFMREVMVRTGGEETPEEEIERLKEFTLGISDFKQNQWELYESVRQLVKAIPTCEGRDPPINFRWRAPRYERPPWEET